MLQRGYVAVFLHLQIRNNIIYPEWRKTRKSRNNFMKDRKEKIVGFYTVYIII